ncbi:MAG: hypothetical protein EP343_03440 [Deltaproteobacteria bacterium]|nr:MAG: hypothetical protein EP343_03440 [Deltaproteobacteria bacterium]
MTSSKSSQSEEKAGGKAVVSPSTNTVTSPQPYRMWSPLKWLSVGVSVVLFGSCFYWGWNPELAPLPPFFSVPLGLLHLGLFALFAGFFRSLILQEAQQAKGEVPTWHKLVLGLWVATAGGALGLLGFSGNVLGLAALAAGLLVGVFHKLNDWFGTPYPHAASKSSKRTSSPKAIFQWYELCLFGVLWLAASFVVLFYGLWFSIAAPFLNLACGILWVLWSRGRFQSSTLHWALLLGLLVVPFFSHSVVSRNQIQTHQVSCHPGFLLGVKYAPFWSTEKRIKTLLADRVSSCLPKQQRTKVYVFLSRLWLEGRISSPLHRELAEYMSVRWLQHLQHDSKLQKAVLHKMLEGFFQYRKSNGGVGYQYDLQRELVEVHKQFPKLRTTLETSLLQALTTPPPCAKQQRPCPQQKAQTLLKAWLSDMLRLGKSQQVPLPSLFPLNDLLWETFYKLPLTHQQRYHFLVSYLRSKTLESAGPTSIFARILIHSVFQSDNFFLDNVKPKASRALMDRWLIQLIQHDLRSDQEEYQFMGFLLFGQACRSQQNGLPLSECNQLVRLFQPTTWRAFRARVKNKTLQEVIHSIEKPSLDRFKRMEMERRLMSLQIKGTPLLSQKNRYLSVLFLKGDKISQGEKKKILNAIKKLDLQRKKLELQGKKVRANYTMDVPQTSKKETPQKPSTRPKQGVTSQPASRPRSLPTKP